MKLTMMPAKPTGLYQFVKEYIKSLDEDPIVTEDIDCEVSDPLPPTVPTALLQPD